MIDLGRWIEDLRPRWIACEQVPAVLPIWRAYCRLLDELGYSTWTGILNAANYGVPQTRRRAILIASLDRHVDGPPPTHAKDPVPSLFGEPLPWVTMADALGWSGEVGFPRLDDLGTFALTEKARSWVLNTGRRWKPGGTREDAQTVDPDEQPAPTLTSVSGRQWQIRAGSESGARTTRRAVDEPAPTLAFGNAYNDWIFERPSTTILGDPRVWPPGHKINQDDRDRLGDDEAKDRYGDRAGSEAIRLSIEDALVLQSFPADYPVAGSKTKQFEQIGNAIPPLLAEHVLRVLLS